MPRRRAWLVAVAALLAAGCAEPPPPSPTVAVDEGGRFRFRPPAGWDCTYAAEGVACLFLHDSALVGRLFPEAHEASFRVRDAEGRLSHHTLAVRDADRDFRDAFRDAVAFASGLGVRSDAFAKVLMATVSGAGGPVPPPVPLPRIGARRRLGADPGRIASVLDGAPDDLVFVRVRSVEAAYRFADEFDRLDALLRAATGDGRDFGTVASTLHHLHLPTIWRTNPEVERGVGELAVVIAPPLVRGPQRAAVLLHVTDADLHGKMTAARKPDYTPPAADPFPDRRVRTNFRRIVDDLEVVSTDADLLEYVATPSAYSIRRMTPYLRIRARLNAGKLHPPPEEALMLYVSPAARDRLRAASAAGPLARRAEEFEQGLHWLARRWTGLPGPGGRCLAPDEDEEHAFVRLEWAVVTTSADGAHVRVRFTSAAPAEAAADALRALSREGVNWAEACADNLLRISPVSSVEPDVTELAARVQTLLGWWPVCPAGGTYSTEPVLREPRCSQHRSLGDARAGESPDPRIDHVAVHASELSFDLRIEWDADTSRPR